MLHKYTTAVNNYHSHRLGFQLHKLKVLMNYAEKRLYQNKPLSPGCSCVVFLAIIIIIILDVY